jgi:DNA topoisomerase-6 subunit B
LYTELQNMKLKAPSTDCLAPMGAEAILSGLLKGIKAEFYTASTRPPAVYRGNPFQIEVGMAYGGELGSDKHDEEADESGNGRAKEEDDVSARVIRFANRVPLLYQQSSCCLFKSVIDTRWNNYGIPQSSGALPRAPIVILIHLASVWVPFISEGKEAIADYDEIRKEVKLAIAECGRRLATLLEATRAMTRVNRDDLRKALIELSKTYTVAADMEFDEHGKVIKRLPGNELGLENTVVVERGGTGGHEGLF